MTDIVKINSKIVSVKVTSNNTKEVSQIPQTTMNEFIERELILEGSTFKVKPANSNHALYITLNAQEIHGKLYPREVFFNTRNPEHKMWMDAMALTLSAVFRKGNDVSFIVDEFKTVYATEGYWGKDHTTGKGKYYKSIIEEIGSIIGIYLDKLDGINGITKVEPVASKEELPVEEPVKYPDNAQVCKDCGEKAAVLMDGCLTCLSCGYSKCS